MSNTSLILSTDLELNLGSFIHVSYLVLAFSAWGLAGLNPAGCKLLFLLNDIPIKYMIYALKCE